MFVVFRTAILVLKKILYKTKIFNFSIIEHDDRGENNAKPIHRSKNTRRVSFKPSGAGGPGGRQFNNKPQQKNLNLAIRATLDDDDDMVDFPNGLNRDGNVSVF